MVCSWLVEIYKKPRDGSCLILVYYNDEKQSSILCLGYWFKIFFISYHVPIMEKLHVCYLVHNVMNPNRTEEC